MAPSPPVVIWFTGLPCSGKTTLSIAVAQQLTASGWPILRLDGDELRRGLNSDLGFSEADRQENVRRTAELARLVCSNGINCIVALVSPNEADREMARSIIGANRFFEIYLSTSLQVCESRDVKGMYRRARSGDLLQFTGVSAPYEMPKNPSLIIDTGSISIRSAAAKIIGSLKT